jgi:hypothetical protein
VERLNARIKAFRYTCNPAISIKERECAVYVACFLQEYKPRICASSALTEDENAASVDAINDEILETFSRDDLVADAETDEQSEK